MEVVPETDHQNVNKGENPADNAVVYPENKKENVPKNTFRNGVLSVIGASFMNLIYPSIFSLCTFVVYQTSYIKNNGGNVTINHTMFYYPVILLFQSIFGLIAGYIDARLHVHWSDLLGSALVVLGSLILFLSKSFALDMVSMAVYGISVAFIMFPATTNACKYFKKRIGLINGIIETVISLGSTFFAFIGEKVINPDEIPSREDDFLYDNEIAKRMKTFLLIQMGCTAGVFIIGLFLNKKYEEDEGKTEQDKNLTTSNNNDAKNDKNVAKNIRKEKLKKALKSWEFWRFNIISLSMSPINNMVFSMYRGIGESKKINQTVLQLIGTLNFIVEVIFSFIYGILCDYVNFKILLFTMNIMGTVVGFIYCLSFGHTFFFTFLTLLITVQGSAYYSLKDYHLMKVFGTEFYIDISGFLCLFTGILVIILTFITYWVEQILVEKDTAYWIMFCIFGGINGIGLVLGFFEKDTPFDYGEVLNQN